MSTVKNTWIIRALAEREAILTTSALPRQLNSESVHSHMESDTPTPKKQYAGQLLTVREVAAILRISEATVRNWVNDGRLEGFSLGKLYRIQGETVDAVLSNSD